MTRAGIGLALLAGACAPVPEARTTIDVGDPGPAPLLAPLDPILDQRAGEPRAAPAGAALEPRGERLREARIEAPDGPDLTARGEALRRRADALRDVEL